uniref:Uncharacterized protein n=1 Tax=Rhizophora mucronata TaxID=61149 RepID=A0A2P2MRR1_RHIMU
MIKMYVLMSSFFTQSTLEKYSVPLEHLKPCSV